MYSVCVRVITRGITVMMLSWMMNRVDLWKSIVKWIKNLQETGIQKILEKSCILQHL